MRNEQLALAEALEYARDAFGEKFVEEDFEMLAERCPSSIIGYTTTRRGLLVEPPEGALSLKMKELIMMGVECMVRKVMPRGHARAAIDAGATSVEVGEVVGLALMLGGMITYIDSGRYSLHAAIDREAELSRTPPLRAPSARPDGPGSALDAAIAYARESFGDTFVDTDFLILAERCPSSVIGYTTTRRGLMADRPEGGLPRKDKELVIIGLESITAKVRPTVHARDAVDHGATSNEVAEVVGLSLMLGGMITYVSSGRYALHAAIEREAELAAARGAPSS